MTRKATRHVNQNEGLIFEKSSAGKAAWKLAPLDVPEVDTRERGRKSAIVQVWLVARRAMLGV